jgi:hypothetical protein
MVTAFRQVLRATLASVAVWLVAASPVAAADQAKVKRALPAFSPEREAAALTFVRNHSPDLAPLLEKLKAADNSKYREEICEIFQFSEALTDLRQDEEKRYKLELDVWKAETKALVLVARLALARPFERAPLELELLAQSRRLVELDLNLRKLRIEELEKELAEVREETSKAEGNREAVCNERYQKLIDQAKRRGMTNMMK